jgi:Cytochrome c3
LACTVCHSTLSWLPVIFRHSGIFGTCQSCHNGVGSSGKPLGHMVTALDCAACHHDTLTWAPAAYAHSGSNYPGAHRAALNCTQCHMANTEQVPWRSPASAPACAACHERNYRAAPHTKYGNVKYTAIELKNCTGACHVYSDATQKGIVKSRPGPQHSVASGQF